MARENNVGEINSLIVRIDYPATQPHFRLDDRANLREGVSVRRKSGSLLITSGRRRDCSLL